MTASVQTCPLKRTEAFVSMSQKAFHFLPPSGKWDQFFIFSIYQKVGKGKRMLLISHICGTMPSNMPKTALFLVNIFLFFIFLLLRTILLFRNVPQFFFSFWLRAVICVALQMTQWNIIKYVRASPREARHGWECFGWRRRAESL
jgi:hypothetical protein